MKIKGTTDWSGRKWLYCRTCKQWVLEKNCTIARSLNMCNTCAEKGETNATKTQDHN